MKLRRSWWLVCIASAAAALTLAVAALAAITEVAIWQMESNAKCEGCAGSPGMFSAEWLLHYLELWVYSIPYALVPTAVLIALVAWFERRGQRSIGIWVLAASIVTAPVALSFWMLLVRLTASNNPFAINNLTMPVALVVLAIIAAVIGRIIRHGSLTR